MKIADVVAVLEEYAPKALQENYDNSGLTIGNSSDKVRGILCSLDVTEEVIKEAINLGANVIVAHHPVIFGGIKSLTGKNYTERIVIKAIQNGIAIIAAHTNVDNVSEGVNKHICTKLGLANTQILAPMQNQLVKLVTFVPETNADEVRKAIFDAGAGQIGNYDNCSYNLSGTGSFRGNESTNPHVGEPGKLHFEQEIRIETILPKHFQTRVIRTLIQAHPYEEVAYDVYPLNNEFAAIGAGMTGEFSEEIKTEAFLKLLKETFGIPAIKYSGNTNSSIKKIAVCGGSGSFLLDKAIASGADAFVTADVKYHQFFDAENTILYCDIGHYESEQFTKEIFYTLLKKKLSNFAVHLSNVITNPVKYYL